MQIEGYIFTQWTRDYRFTYRANRWYSLTYLFTHNISLHYSFYLFLVISRFPVAPLHFVMKTQLFKSSITLALYTYLNDNSLFFDNLMHSYINTSILTELILFFGCLITQVYNGLQLCFHGESLLWSPYYLWEKVILLMKVMCKHNTSITKQMFSSSSVLKHFSNIPLHFTFTIR